MLLSLLEHVHEIPGLLSICDKVSDLERGSSGKGSGKRHTVSGEEGDGGAFGTSTTSTTNTVDIILRVIGVVIVDHVSNVAHIFKRGKEKWLANRELHGRAQTFQHDQVGCHGYLSMFRDPRWLYFSPLHAGSVAMKMPEGDEKAPGTRVPPWNLGDKLDQGQELPTPCLYR